MAEGPLVLGLAGSFGSGCSTLAQTLRDYYNFRVFSLTAFLKTEWERRLRERGEPERVATRAELQDLGNELRQSQGHHVLAEKALQAAKAEANDSVVFDSIKNLAEVTHLRANNPEFYLLIVQCSSSERWHRVEAKYAEQQRPLDHFYEDDLRDQLEADLPHGQQVQLCVDQADIVITNEVHAHSRFEATRNLEIRISPFLGLISHDKPRYPDVDEVMMAVAYMQATRSRCIKRQVGAIIVDQQDNIVSIAFNENPPPIELCGDRSRCEKEWRMLGEIESLRQCPCCKSPFAEANAFRQTCEKCGINLGKALFPDRGAKYCRAMHAEETAIRQSPRRDLRGCTLYTTTFPCYGCAKVIVAAGIRRVVYVEPYPEQNAAELLQEAGCDVQLFEGVKARAFHRLFAPVQREMESRFSMKI